MALRANKAAVVFGTIPVRLYVVDLSSKYC